MKVLERKLFIKKFPNAILVEEINVRTFGKMQHIIIYEKIDDKVAATLYVLFAEKRVKIAEIGNLCDESIYVDKCVGKELAYYLENRFECMLFSYFTKGDEQDKRILSAYVDGVIACYTHMTTFIYFKWVGKHYAVFSFLIHERRGMVQCLATITYSIGSDYKVDWFESDDMSYQRPVSLLIDEFCKGLENRTCVLLNKERLYLN